MFAHAVKHHTKRALMEISNHQKLTPLTLASKMGRMQVFNEIIELQSYEIWRYSNITCSVYPLAPLDTIGKDGKMNQNAALIYITDGDTDGHLEMLDDGIIKQLLADKWKKYGRKRFFERLMLALFHLITLSVAIYTRPDEVILTLPPTSVDATTIVRYVAESIVAIYCFLTIVMQIFEVRSDGGWEFLKRQADAPAKCIFNISCVLIMLCIPMRLSGQQSAERILLALAAPCSWALLLFFARGLSLYGPLVVTIYTMLANDLIRFLIIYIIMITLAIQGRSLFDV